MTPGSLAGLKRSYTCSVCSVTLNSIEQYHAHLKGSKHQTKCVSSCFSPRPLPVRVCLNEYICNNASHSDTAAVSAELRVFCKHRYRRLLREEEGRAEPGGLPRSHRRRGH